jgi:hypothetical protein
MKRLPHELILRILELSSGLTHLSIGAVCKAWRSLSKVVAVKVITLLEINNTLDPLCFKVGDNLKIDHFDEYDHHICFHLMLGRESEWILINSLLEHFKHELIEKRQTRCRFIMESVVAFGWVPQPFISFVNSFRHIKIREPFSINFDSLPTTCRRVEFETIQRELELDGITKLHNLKELRIESSGRFSNGEGYHRTVNLKPISTLPLLTKLTLEGPWFQDLVDSKLRLFEFLSSLKNLTSLIAGKLILYQTLTASD